MWANNLGTNTSSLEAFLVWYAWQMSYSSVSFLLQINWAILSWKILLSCCIILVRFYSLPGVEVCLHMVPFLFLLKIRSFFLNSSLNWRCVWALEKEPVDEETRISCSDTSGGLLFILQPEAWTISQQSCLGVCQKQQKRTQLKVCTSFAKSLVAYQNRVIRGCEQKSFLKPL